MTSINYQQIDSLLQSFEDDPIPCVILLYGDSYIKREIFNRFLDFFMKDDTNAPSIESFQGDDIHIGTITESLNTLSFLFPKKLLLLREMPLFEKGRLSKEDIQSFTNAIRNGFPENHIMLISTRAVDKRKGTYKTIEKAGVIVDCSIPQGSRMADIREKERIFRSIVNQKLFKADKAISEHAFKRLIQRTGYDLSVVLNHIDNLVSYCGQTSEIQENHVQAVVKKTKKDPIFNLSNALLDRNLESSLSCLSSLRHEGFHPLQILTAMVNQFRKLLFVKSFIQYKSEHRQPIWQKGMDFNRFKDLTVPVMKSYEIEIKEKIQSSDLFLASQTKNPYSLYQIFLKSDRFSLNELNHFHQLLNNMDYNLKSSSSNPDEHLTQFLIQVCVKET